MRCGWSVLLLAAMTGLLKAESPAPETDPEVVAYLGAIEARGDSLTSLQARLRYDTVQALLGDAQTRFGTLLYEAGPPQRFRINFTGLVEGDQTSLRRQDQRWIFDGRWLAEIDGLQKSATLRELVAADQVEHFNFFSVDNPYAVLPFHLKRDVVLERYTVTLVRPVQDHPVTGRTVPGAFQLRLLPRPNEDQPIPYSEILLWFDEQTMLPLLVHARDEDGSGDEISILLTTPQADLEIPEGIFDVRPPADDTWQIEIVPLEG